MKFLQVASVRNAGTCYIQPTLTIIKQIKCNACIHFIILTVQAGDRYLQTDSVWQLNSTIRSIDFKRNRASRHDCWRTTIDQLTWVNNNKRSWHMSINQPKMVRTVLYLVEHQLHNTGLFRKVVKEDKWARRRIVKSSFNGTRSEEVEQVKRDRRKNEMTSSNNFKSRSLNAFLHRIFSRLVLSFNNPLRRNQLGLGYATCLNQLSVISSNNRTYPIRQCIKI